MRRLNYLLLQGLLLLIPVEQVPLLQNGEKHQVDASQLIGKFACQDEVMNIRCWWPKVISIKRATYLRTQSSICSRSKGGLNSGGYCDPVAKTSMASSLCDGQVTCRITVNNSTMGDHCSDVFKYLSVVYICKTAPTTTQPPDVLNKSTMVLTKPSSAVPSLNRRRTERPTKRTFFPLPTDDDEYHSIIDVGFILNDKAGERHQVDEGRLRSKFACQDDVMIIRCWWPKVISIYWATYLRTQSSICSRSKGGLNSKGNCDPMAKTSMASSLCDGQVTCSITVNSSTMGDHCPDVFKYLSVLYTCKRPPLTTQPPDVLNKSTMVLTKPSSPVPSLNRRRTGRPTKRTLFPVLIDDDEYHSIIDVGFILNDRACIYTNSSFFVVMLILAVIV